MKVVIEGKVYNSEETPILLILGDESVYFDGMQRYVSAPSDSTKEERQALIDMEVI